jgi:hypothetical protein
MPASLVNCAELPRNSGVVAIDLAHPRSAQRAHLGRCRRVRLRPCDTQISELIFEFRVPTYPYNAPNLPGSGATRRTRIRTSAHSPVLPGRGQRSYTIGEALV